MLVGLITETYVAKVTFYGLRPDAYRILGVAPESILFIIFFYHAFFSFLAPAYMAKRLLGMPLPISRRRLINLSYVIIPLILLPAVSNQLIDRGLSVLTLMLLLGISAVVLSVWILLLRSMGDIKNVLLSRKERRVLLLITLVFYVVFLFMGTNRAHGHAPGDFPLLPMLAVTAVIVALLVLLNKALSKGKKPRQEVFYSPRSINLPVFFAWLFWHLSVVGVLIMFRGIIGPLLKIGLNLLGIAGVVIGTMAFVSSLIYLLKTVLR